MRRSRLLSAHSRSFIVTVLPALVFGAVLPAIAGGGSFRGLGTATIFAQQEYGPEGLPRNRAQTAGMPTLKSRPVEPAPVRPQDRLRALAAPANDNFQNAQVLAIPSTVTGSNIDATLEAGESSPSCGGTGASVWFRFTPGTAGVFSASALGNFNTALALYTGSSVSSLTQMACSNNGTMDSRVSASVTAGTTYALRLAGFGGESGSYSLDVSLGPPSPITEFLLPTGALAGSITLGPDGALWFTETSRNRVGRITTAGVITEFPVPTPNSAPRTIVTGPDGALWFTEAGADQIGRITMAGVITEFGVGAGTLPLGLTSGPDGALWFTEFNVNRIGRMTTDGIVSSFPGSTSFASAQPVDIVRGPDGALWVAEFGAPRVGRITTGGTFTEFVVPSNSDTTRITLGPDGALWFTEALGGRIGRVTSAGVVTEFPLPTSISGQVGIVAGPDGALWFTESNSNEIGRITTTGNVTEFDIPTNDSSPVAITAGPDGAVWFTELGADKIGRMPVSTLGNAATLNGTVSLQGLTAGTTGYQVALEVRLFQPGGTVPVNTLQATTDVNGNFSVSGITPGVYDVEVKESRRIGRIARNLSLAAGINTQSFGDLLAGDVNGDDTVGLVDYSRLRASFGKCSGDTGYQPGADFNGDNCITLQDYSRLRANFGIAGPLNIAP